MPKKPWEEYEIKGQTYGELLKSEKGRGTLRWVASQPLPTEPDKEKLKFWAEARNKWIHTVLAPFADDVQEGRPASPTEKEQTTMTMLMNILDNTREILKKMDKHPTKEVWDEEKSDSKWEQGI